MDFGPCNGCTNRTASPAATSGATRYRNCSTGTWIRPLPGRKAMSAGDFGQARKHLEAAVNAGDGGAACLLGEMTLKGQGGITANQEASAKLFQLAQSRGSICFTSGP